MDLFRYAVVVSFVEGRDRGFIVHANNRGEAVEKVLNILRQTSPASSASGFWIASFTISEVLLEEDEIK